MSFFSAAELARRTEAARPVVERLEAAGCRYTQIEAPDINGTLRGKILPLADGFSSAGTAFGQIMVSVKGGGEICLAPFLNMAAGGGKMVAVPDLSTAVVLPWKRDVAGVLCDYYMNDGSPCPMDPRHILSSVEALLVGLNYSGRVALEYEVYIVEQNDLLMREGRFTELASFGRDRDFYSISRSPSFEELAKEFMARCAAAGVQVEAFHSEYGRGMFEYTFAPQTPLKAADDSVRAKLYLKQLCAERGLVACYMVAKSAGTGDTYCGCHHNFSLFRGTENSFWDRATMGLSQPARHAAAGILETMPAFTLIFHPWVNSYRRTDRLVFTPETASWGDDNHFAGLRVVHGAVPERMTRFEHRVPGADVNPYLSIASIIIGCLRGLRDLKEPPPYAKGPSSDSCWTPLPRSLQEAIGLFGQSQTVSEALGKTFVEHFSYIKEDEWKDFTAVVPPTQQGAAATGPVTDWEVARYFNHA